VIDRALGLYDQWRDEDGLVADQHGKGMWNFIDWGYPIAGVELDGKTAALNMLIAAAFKQAGELHEAVGNDERASELKLRSVETVNAIRKKFRLEQEGHFFDCTEPGNGRRTFSQVPHAVGVYFDLLDETEREEALDVLLDDAAVRAEYGYQLFVLDSLVRGGRAAQALEIIHQLWGHMAAAGAPTFWEVADGRSSMTGCGSLCHAFSCAPMYFLQTTLLGVRPLQPGFSEFSLCPEGLGVLWAKGDVGTPHGLIHVEWTTEKNGRLCVTVQVPEGTTAVLADDRRLGSGCHRFDV